MSERVALNQFLAGVEKRAYKMATAEGERDWGVADDARSE